MNREPKYVVVRRGRNGPIEYEGPDNRRAFEEKTSGLPFNMTSGDLIQCIILIIAVVTFYVKTNERLDRHDKDITYLNTFAQTSDEWHSTATGTRFHGGAPVDGQFNNYSHMRRSSLNGNKGNVNEGD